MAEIIKTDGTKEQLNDCSLASLQKAVGGYIEIIYLKDGKILVVDEEGLLKDKPKNTEASSLAMVLIVGDAVLADSVEVK